MGFFAREPVWIQKAAPRKVPRTYARVRALSNTMTKAVKVDLVDGITAFKQKVSPQALMSAWSTKSYGAIMATIPWEQLPDHLEPATSKLSESLVGSAKRTIELLPPPVKNGLRWDIKNPRISKFLREQTGKLVVDIRQDTLDVVQRAVQRSFTQAYTPQDVAEQIRDSIGLHPIYEQAVVNYQNGLFASGKHTPDQIDQLTDAYSNKLLDVRAMTIARTEVRGATNYGQLSVWQQGKNDGLLTPQTKKTWVTCKECVSKTPSPCDLCLPMDGESIPLDEFWVLADGSVCEVPSDAHPNCNCGMTVDMGDGTEETKEEED